MQGSNSGYSLVPKTNALSIRPQGHVTVFILVILPHKQITDSVGKRTPAINPTHICLRIHTDADHSRADYMHQANMTRLQESAYLPR